MKTLISKVVMATAIVAAAAFTSNAAMAASTVKVPFDFKVGNKVAQAGTYSVKSEGNGGIVTLQSEETAQTFSMIIGPGADEKQTAPVVLRFSAVGSTPRLHTVQLGHKITGALDKRVNERETIQTVVGQ